MTRTDDESASDLKDTLNDLRRGDRIVFNDRVQSLAVRRRHDFEYKSGKTNTTITVDGPRGGVYKLTYGRGRPTSRSTPTVERVVDHGYETERVDETSLESVSVVTPREDVAPPASVGDEFKKQSETLDKWAGDYWGYEITAVDRAANRLTYAIVRVPESTDGTEWVLEKTVTYGDFEERLGRGWEPVESLAADPDAQPNRDMDTGAIVSTADDDVDRGEGVATDGGQLLTTSDREIVAVDLFCGAGGFSEGLRQACDELGYGLKEAAINHWQQAVDTHEANHPDAHQYHSKVEQLHPPNVIRELTGEDRPDVDLLVGGPECTHFSRARGGKPVCEQRRMSPWHILDWLEKLNVESFVIENVPEIQQWGPVDDEGQPVRDGSIFDAWVNALNQLGYAVDWTQLTAADYGDPTTRERFFIIGRQAGRVTFPEPSHSDDVGDGLKQYRTAAEIIDWSDLGDSIWTRDLTNNRIHTPPKDTTMQRIAEGIRRHCDDSLAAFADTLETMGREEIRELRTERAVDRDEAETLAAAVDEPFLVRVGGASPEQTLLLRQQDGGDPYDAYRQPVPTIASRGAHAIATVSRSLLMPKNGRRGGLHSNELYDPASRPFHTVTADPRAKLVSPYLCPLYSSRRTQAPRTRAVDRPLMTVPKSKSPAALSTPVVRPFIDDYEGPPKSVDQPLNTIETRDRFALCVPELWPWGLDIRYRMLQPRELKQAQGFPADYEITGTKTDRRAQIGNAVPVNLAESLCRHVLTATDPSLSTFGGGLADGDDVDIPSYDEVVSDD